MADVSIGVVGAAGRMGLTLVRQIAATPGCKLAGGTERAASPMIGRDLGELAGIGPTGQLIGDDPLPLFAKANAVIDFTSPSALAKHAELAAQGKTVLIVGTTGLEDKHIAALKEAARHAPIVQEFNMSVGVNLIAGLVRQVAALLDTEWDIEIVEMHHRQKVDAPSGTAVLFGEMAAKGRNVELADVADKGRDGLCGPRQKGDIGFASLRGGNVIGEHTVIFAAENERVELTHRAADRGLFARGAVQAALWAQGKPPGLYKMADVLGFRKDR